MPAIFWYALGIEPLDSQRLAAGGTHGLTEGAPGRSCEFRRKRHIILTRSQKGTEVVHGLRRPLKLDNLQDWYSEDGGQKWWYQHHVASAIPWMR